MSKTWTAAGLLHSLSLMDWSLNDPLDNREWQNYCDYYQLPLNDNNAQTHHAGLLQIAGFSIVAQVWEPKQVKGNAFLVHGLYDHVGLYRHLIKYCLSKGWRVIAFDLPGHGLSSGKRAAINSFQQYDQVFTKMLTNICLHFSEPIHVFGQSTGGAIIINYLLKYEVKQDNSPFKSVNLISPLVRPKSWRKMNLLLPFVRRRREEVARAVSTNSHALDFLTFVQTIDPLQTKALSVSWINAVIQWNKFIERTEESDIAINTVQGTEDYSVIWQYNMGFLKRKFPNGAIEIIPNARHHMVNETEEFQQPMWDFFDQQIN